MKALTIINPGRLAVFGPVLDILLARNVITSWHAVSVKSRKNTENGIADKYKNKITYIQDGFFKNFSTAQDYVYSLASKYEYFDFGIILAAEKRVPEYFPHGIIDMAAMFRTVENLINGKKCDVLIDDYLACALDMAAYQMCKSKDIPTIFIGGSRIRNRLFFSYEPEKGLKEYISYHYYKYKTNGLDNKKRERSQEFLNFFKETQYKPFCMSLNLFEDQKLPNSSVIKKMASFALDSLTNPSAALSRVKNKISKTKLKNELNNIFEPIDDRDRIIFFPIQYQPEASTYVRSPYFKNQYALIENLCISIPAGYTLYVKEHPRHIFRKSASFFKDYKESFPNLKFLDLTVDSHDIIKRSRLVVVLSSTAGWEAFLYGIPVLQFGTAFYSQFKGIHPFQGYQTFSKQIKEILVNHRPDENEIFTAIAASFDGTLPGYMNDPQWDGSVLDEQNLRNIADLIVKGIEFYPE